MFGDPAERFRLIAESISEVFWIGSADFKQVLYINPAFERVWGRTRESAMRDPRAFLEALHPDDRERVVKAFEARHHGAAFDHEYRIVRPDGTIRWIWGRGGPIRDEHGAIAFFMGIAQDITDRKRMESELAAMAERFVLASRATSDGIWDWDIRTNAGWWSDSYYALCGYDRSTVPSYEVWSASIHEDDRARVLAGVERVLAGNEIAWSDEYRLVRPSDGKQLDVFDRAYVQLDATGKPVRMLGALMDITDRKRMESELAAMAERFALVTRATNDGIWDWDMRTNVTWGSDAYYTLFGLERSSTPTYEIWASCIHPDDRARVLAHFEHMLARNETTWSDDYRFIRRSDGAVLDVFDRAYVLHDEAGKPVRMVGALMDITARRKLENQLRHAQKMEAIGQLAGGIAHDFNNILQAVTLELSLAASPDLPASTATHIAESLSALERAASLTRQLLVFSRQEAMRPRRIDLNAKLVDLMRMVRRMIGEDIALQLDLAPGAILIDADPAMIDQVLVNLALNARDAMPNGGTLAISTSIDGDGRACILVRDTGAGILPEHLPRVFEPFFTTKDATGGTGLGLATVHGIIEQHRGRIEVSSEAGRGATFRIHLPLSDTTLNAREEREPPPKIARGTETILLVEDDDIVRRALRATLQQAGYRVVEAARGATALQHLADGGAVDLVLTDMVMPDGISGRDLAGRITTRWPNVCVVFITGYSREDSDLRDNETLLRKPIDREHLLNALRASLDRRATT